MTLACAAITPGQAAAFCGATDAACGRGRKRLLEVELRGVLVADKIVGQLPQPKDLPPGKSLQVGKDRHGLLPVVADPGQRIEDQAEVIAAQMFQQALGRSAGTRGVGGQFRPVAGDAGGVRTAGIRPRASAGGAAAARAADDTGVAVQFAIQSEAQGQQFRVGKVEAVAPAARDRLEREVLEEPAMLGAAEADAPGDAAAGITGQPQGAVPRADRLVIQ